MLNRDSMIFEAIALALTFGVLAVLVVSRFFVCQREKLFPGHPRSKQIIWLSSLLVANGLLLAGVCAASFTYPRIQCFLWEHSLYAIDIDAYDPNGPNGLRYLFWKRNLCTMDLDKAVGIMSVDFYHGQELVLGKRKEELQKRFGYLSSPSNAGPYIQNYYNSMLNGKDVVFLRGSSLAVTFEKGVAVNVTLVKGY